MKLRSIALAGLLGTGLIMTSGCGVDDVEEFIQEAVKTAYITVANGQTSQNFNIGSIGTVPVGEYLTDFTANLTQDSYIVSHGDPAEDAVSFPKGGGHLYGLCAAPHATTSANVVADSNDGTRFKIVNLGVTDSTAVVITLTTGDQDVTATVSADVCTKQAIPEFDAVDITKVTAVSIDADGAGSTPAITIDVPTYEPEVQTVIDQLGDRAEFDLIVFDLSAGKGTIVPIVAPVD